MTPQQQEQHRSTSTTRTTEAARSRPAPPPETGALVNAPAVHFERLSDRQRHGRSCCWCAGTPDRRFPVRILRGADVRLYACLPCASMYGVTEVS
ncbi:hypothetical protein [Streptomyces sp. TRM68367]|uniref:hypothetical protein n=1 Tax=Streptomyces sp. TRM68367 TaxID=2758415 RepID=UPI00165BD464|nr:hypothetical protein [Streptomyces sp. TRM68367]MBC9730240.1 hypothetical protein [Streptomyces sp. TRM68367]